jgi:Tol biopolymer transport system component
MNIDGSNAINLTKGNANAMSADWSPDKSKIVFDAVDSYLAGLPVCHISTMNADGSNVSRISPGASSRHYPTWSPDGSKIANSKYFVAACNHATPCKYFQLFSTNQSGTEDGPAKFSNETGYQLLPRWFPDSKRIAYLDFETGFYEIHSGDIVTGDTIKYDVESNTAYMPWFALSPDGTRIVYSHDLSRDYMHSGRELFIFDITTGETIRLTNNDYADDNPCFSRDGKQIAFASFGNSEETSGMFIMDLDGKSVNKIPSKSGDMPMKWK